MTGALARALWEGSLSDPAAPARALAGTIARRAPYAEVLPRLRALRHHALPLAPALSPALARWPGSIDMALVAVADDPHDPDLDAALDHLESCVRAQNRRFGALARALWRADRRAAAHRALETLDPASDSYADDLATRAELLILDDRAAAPVPGPRGAQLSLLATWRQDGAAALLRRVEIEGAGLPAHPPLWTWLIGVFIVERDFDAAKTALNRMTERLPPDHPAVRRQRIRLLLEAENTSAARALLDADASRRGDAARPWDWPEPVHAQHLRCGLSEAAEAPDTLVPLADHAERACRLHPRNGVLRMLRQTLREVTAPWDTLADDPELARTDPALAARSLAHLGLHTRALEVLAEAPLTAERAALHARQRAELLLRQGRTAEAAVALGPAPDGWPQQAEHAYWASEIALARRDIGTAQGILDTAMARGPTRMGLVLNAARAAYFAGDFDKAERFLARFHTLKTAQLGAAPEDDLRDRIIADALTARAQALPDTASPGLAARALALAPPAFTPQPDTPAIPRTLWHYWEGPRSAPLERGIAAWQAHHPDWTQVVFNAGTAQAWLDTHAPTLGPLFARLSSPAARADLFRLALLVKEGGVFSDLDEYPRAPVAGWLSQARAVLVIEEGHGTIANNFLAVVPGLPLIRRTLERAAHNLARTDTPYPWWDCGPAPLTVETLVAARDPHETPGLRLLAQAEYDQRVATNLPFPHKRSALHWR